MTLSVSVK